jgi:hypothetical protein
VLVFFSFSFFGWFFRLSSIFLPDDGENRNVAVKITYRVKCGSEILLSKMATSCWAIRRSSISLWQKQGQACDGHNLFWISLRDFLPRYIEYSKIYILGSRVWVVAIALRVAWGHESSVNQAARTTNGIYDQYSVSHVERTVIHSLFTIISFLWIWQASWQFQIIRIWYRAVPICVLFPCLSPYITIIKYAWGGYDIRLTARGDISATNI